MTAFLMHNSQGLVVLLFFVCFFPPVNSCGEYVSFYVKGKNETSGFICTVCIVKILGPILFLFSVKPGYISQPNV